MSEATAQSQRMTYTEFLDNSPMSSALWLLLLGCCLAQLLDGMDSQASSFAVTGIIKTFKLNPAQAGVIFSINNIGFMLGGIFFPLLCDLFGRKTVFQWVLITYPLGTLINALAPDYHTLLFGRFIAGIGFGAQIPIVFAILAEFAPKRLRHVFVPLGPVFWGFGWVTAALLSIWLMPVYGWRMIYWVGITPAVMILFVRRFVPESIRYLVMKGRIEEAGHITADLAKKAGMADVELVPPLAANNQQKMGFGQRLRMLQSVRAPLLVLLFFYFCFSIQNWGLNSWLPSLFLRQGFTLTKSFSYTLMIFAVTPVSQVIAMWLQNRINRKWALFMMTAGGTVFFILFGLSFAYKWPVQVLVGAQIMQTLLTQGVVGIMFTLGTEYFPTPVRTFGIGIVSGGGRFGAVVGPFALGLFLYFGTSTSRIIYMFAIPLVIAAILAVIVIKIDPRRQSLESIGSRQYTAAAVQSAG